MEADQRRALGVADQVHRDLVENEGLPCVKLVSLSRKKSFETYLSAGEVVTGRPLQADLQLYSVCVSRLNSRLTDSPNHPSCH